VGNTKCVILPKESVKMSIAEIILTAQTSKFVEQDTARMFGALPIQTALSQKRNA